MGDPERPDAPILCLGEAIVDLICEEEVEAMPEARSFRPHFGGALANVAVAIARAGGEASLAAGVGDDPWGRWLRERLQAEAVGLRWFSLVDGLQTPLAFVTFDGDREPRFRIYGDGIDAGVRAVEEHVGEAVAAAGALVFGSNTLVGTPERELTMRARDLALDRGIPVLFDPNVRPNRWDDVERAFELCREACERAFMVRANLDEARRISGLPPQTPAAEAADALCALGARLAVVTLGAAGVVVRGEVDAQALAPRVEVVAPLGAGDAFLGTLAAGVAQGGWASAAVADSLAEACEAGARACTGWGALE